jgi:hypothetical protein
VDEPKMQRGWLPLYVVAFALMLASGGLLVAGSLGGLDSASLRLLRISWGASAVAIVVAIASVLVPRRR